MRRTKIQKPQKCNECRKVKTEKKTEIAKYTTNTNNADLQ